jgi:hypothetical protein
MDRCPSLKCAAQCSARKKTEFSLRMFSYEMWNRVVWLVNSNVSDVHVVSFFRADYDTLEDGDCNTQSHKNLKSREFCLRVIKFLSFERVYMSCIAVYMSCIAVYMSCIAVYMSYIAVLSLLVGFPTEFLTKIMSAMLTLRNLSPLDFAVITVVFFLFE